MKSLYADLKRRMDQAVAGFQSNLAATRTGRASAHMLDQIKVDYYGTLTPVTQMAQVSTAEAQTILIQPYDPSIVKEIEKAIQASDLGFNPLSDGKLIRVPVPPMTEERRRDLVKVVRHKAEEGRVAVRNLRRGARHELDALEKDGELSRDELERLEEDFEKVTHEQVEAIDQLLAHKERELLEV